MPIAQSAYRQAPQVWTPLSPSHEQPPPAREKPSLRLRARPAAIQIALLIYAAATVLGCTTVDSRETVIANTESGLGVFVKQNPRSQMYEGKLGYFRHELFIVPTSKRVVEDAPAASTLSSSGRHPQHDGNFNDPSHTPNVFADVRVGGAKNNGARRFDIQQRLIVGEAALEAARRTRPLASESAADTSTDDRPRLLSP